MAGCPGSACACMWEAEGEQHTCIGVKLSLSRSPLFSANGKACIVRLPPHSLVLLFESPLWLDD